MNYTFFIISVLGFFIASFCSVYVLSRDPSARLNRLFFLFNMAIAFFNLFDAFGMLTPYAPYFIDYSSLKRFFWLLFWPLFLQFCLVLSKSETPATKKILLPFFYLSAAIVWVIDLRTRLIFLNPGLTLFGYYEAHGPYFILYGLYLVSLALIIINFLYSAYRKSVAKREKNQMRAILFGMLSVSSLGFTADVIMPSFGITIQSFIPFMVTIYAMIFSYAIVKYGLLTVTPGQIADDILRTMPDIAMFIDTRRSISIVNQAFIRLLGYSRSEVMDRPFSMIFSQEPEVQMVLNGTLKKGRIEGIRITLKKKDGTIIPVRVDSTITKDRSGEEIGIIMIFRDISQVEALIADQQKNISELTRTKERMLSILEDTAEARDMEKERSAELAVALENMKSVDKMKTEFLSVISHELRTPLTPIIGYISMFMDQTFGALAPEYIKKAEIIKKESVHLHGLIESLLDVSRMERGVMMQVNKEPVSFKALLDELALVMKPQFDSRKMTLEIKIPENFPSIMGDTIKLNRLLTNLLGNTLKYVPEGGIVKISGVKEEGMVKVDVADNGIGIAKENLDKIFEKFYQVDSSYTRSAGGVGLGLAIAKEIVTAHGGKLWAESEGLGRGTKFIFTLPIA